jgi:threonine/homoserine/homoserine lactone efflux protein
LGLLTDGCYAMAAGTAGHWIKRNRGYLRFERYVSGTVLVGLGLTAAFAGHGEK